MNWFKRQSKQENSNSELTNSILYNETSFYNQFNNDLLEAKKEVIIESPFITSRRLNVMKPIFERLILTDVEVYILTRQPHEHDTLMAEQAERAIRYFEVLGVQVLLSTGGHHRKLAMIDRRILWEGSLNILSQVQSREFMRRIQSEKLTEELFQFLKFDTLNIFRKNLDLL
jgi:phosphatidylserine/phosphatidylglycerophosphate/cardiolipin synthase-like enzyme